MCSSDLNISPIQVGTSSWTSISAGASVTAGISSDKLLYTWGSNTYGQLGIPFYQANNKQFTIGGQIAAGIKDGTLWTIGFNGQGQLLGSFQNS